MPEAPVAQRAAEWSFGTARKVNQSLGPRALQLSCELCGMELLSFRRTNLSLLLGAGSYISLIMRP